MPYDSTPKVFISATSRDLASYRRLAKEVLLTLGCTPVEQTNFPPDARSIREMLRAKIAECRAVVHIAGEAYGSEPQQRVAGEPRRSYTQLEYEIARELKKPVYVFVCGEGFPYDAPPVGSVPESEELRLLQQQHRQRLIEGEGKFEFVASVDELNVRLHALQARVQELIAHIKRQHRRLQGLAALGAGAVVAIAGSLYWLDVRSKDARNELDKQKKEVQKITAELDLQREYLKAVANRYSVTEVEYRKQELTSEQIYKRSIDSVASTYKMTPAQLQVYIDVFVAKVQSDPNGDFTDRALADFARRDFKAAAENAATAADRAEKDRMAAEARVRQLSDDVRALKRTEVEARMLAGKSRTANRQYAEAMIEFEKAIALVDKDAHSSTIAELRFHVGIALFLWGEVSTGELIRKRYSESIENLTVAAEAYDLLGAPLEGMQVRRNIAIVLQNEFEVFTGAEAVSRLDRSIALLDACISTSKNVGRSGPQIGSLIADRAGSLLLKSGISGGEIADRTLDLAIEEYRRALLLYTDVDSPQDLKTLRNNLAVALSTKAEASSGSRAKELLLEALELHRSTAAMVDRNDPRDQAGFHVNLGSVLSKLSDSTEGRSSFRYASEGAEEFKRALSVTSEAEQPREWAKAQMNLGTALTDSARGEVGDARVRILDEGRSAFLASLKVISKDVLPRDWATAQSGLAINRMFCAESSEGETRERCIDDAVSAFRAALTVNTLEASPREWSAGMNNLANALSERAEDSSDSERDKALDEVIDIHRSVLNIHTRSAHPEQWARSHHNLGNALMEKSEFQKARKKKKAFLDEAIASFELALQVRVRDTFPVYWAMTVDNLGCALRLSAEVVTEREEKRLMLDRSIANLRSALEVRTLSDRPFDFGATQDHLASSWFDLSEILVGADRMNALASAVAACRNALLVKTPITAPPASSELRVRLCSLLAVMAMDSEGDEKIAAVKKVESECEIASRVIDRRVFSAEWESIQRIRQGAMLDVSEILEGAEKARCLTLAATSTQGLLESVSKEKRPSEWAELQCFLAMVKEEIGGLESSAEARGRSFGEAASALKSALTVYTWAATPNEWEQNKLSLCELLRRQAKELGSSSSESIYREGAAAIEDVLRVRTRKSSPMKWAFAQYTLALLTSQWGIGNGDTVNGAILLRSRDAARSALEVFTPKAERGLNADIVELLSIVEAKLATVSPTSRP